MNKHPFFKLISIKNQRGRRNRRGATVLGWVEMHFVWAIVLKENSKCSDPNFVALSGRTSAAA